MRLVRSSRFNHSKKQKFTNFQKKKSSFHSRKKYGKNGNLGKAFFVSALIGFFGLVNYGGSEEINEGNDEEKSLLFEAGLEVKGLPVYSVEDVAEHNSEESGVWVYYGDGVYDVSEFVAKHPGGKRILMAAGSSIEPFWALYGQHQTEEVYKILEGYRIGNLKPGSTKVEVDLSDPYCNDPERFPGLKVHQRKPFNSEIPLELIMDNFITPNQMFYIRNHLPVPVIDPEEYRLTIGGIGFEEIVLTLDDLKKFPKREVTATIQCAGNRRKQMNSVRKVRGLEWEGGAISNATWGGVFLRDVLISMGFDEEKHPEILHHIHLEGFDTDSTRNYGASIPIEKGISKVGDVLLAWEMNGTTLPPDHGYPLRIIVPGTAGARNVKWLKNIYLSDEESPNHWQQNDYKGFSPGIDWDSVDYNTAPSIQELPVQSAICNPSDNAVFSSSDYIPVNGYAWSGAGRSIIRVDVSFDGGETWKIANLQKPNQPAGRNWAWTFWDIDLDIPENTENVEIICKAIDSQYNTQPGEVSAIWNLRGVLSNPWDRIKIKIVD